MNRRLGMDICVCGCSVIQNLQPARCYILRHVTLQWELNDSYDRGTGSTRLAENAWHACIIKRLSSKK